MPALGKGLGSLIPSKTKKDYSTSAFDNTEADNNRIQYVATSKISSNPWQPRHHFDRDKLEELAESIKQHGILQPLVVTKEENGYQLIAGERRLKAAELLNMEEVPIIVKEVSDRDKLELSIIENIQRRDLDPIETAKSYKRLMDEFGLTYEQIGEQLGKSASSIANFVRLLKLPIVIQESLEKGEIKFSHAKLILSFQTKPEQIKFFKRILKNDLSLQQLHELTQKSAAKQKKKEARDPVLASWEDKITKNLGAKTTIQKRGERGFVKINFFSHAELKNLLDKLEQ